MQATTWLPATMHFLLDLMQPKCLIIKMAIFNTVVPN